MQGEEILSADFVGTWFPIKFVDRVLFSSPKNKEALDCLQHEETHVVHKTIIRRPGWHHIWRTGRHTGHFGASLGNAGW
jgi:hypothetical protein